MSKYLIFYILFFSQLVFSQKGVEKLIHGKIEVAFGNVEGVNVINLVNQKSTTSDTNGDFYILVKEEDVLVFSSVNLEYHRKIIEKEDLNSDVLILKMTLKVTELKEIVINKYPKINAVSLGISSNGLKHRTQMERKLYAAEEFHWYSPLLIPFGGMSVDGMINSISGRTAMLKKELKVEKKERWLVYLATLFEKEYYTNTLKIPSEYIKGFHYYCLDDPYIMAILESKNKIKIEFSMIELAKKYNEIISFEN